MKKLECHFVFRSLHVELNGCMSPAFLHTTVWNRLRIQYKISSVCVPSELQCAVGEIIVLNGWWRMAAFHVCILEQPANLPPHRKQRRDILLPGVLVFGSHQTAILTPV